MDFRLVMRFQMDYPLACALAASAVAVEEPIYIMCDGTDSRQIIICAMVKRCVYSLYVIVVPRTIRVLVYVVV
jgi:hypothetical protein